MKISWISIIICLALAVDALRRSAWVAHPKQGKTRLGLPLAAWFWCL
jgi:hypothetical protein